MSSRKRYKVGIVGYVVDKAAFGVGLAYMKYFSQLGDVTIINNTETEVREDLDLLVIPGGPDVDVTRYLKEGEVANVMTGPPCPIRERFDRVLLPKYIENGTPIFGICRGHQSLAVHFGGTLIQDMWHEQNNSNRREHVHMVSVNNEELLKYTGSTLKNDKDKTVHVMSVNSIHHQAVAHIPKNAISIAHHKMNPNDGFSKYYESTNEALLYTDRKIASVQYHPEEIDDSLAAHLILNYLLAK